MRRNIPTTNGLLAFEVAGRHESFSRAAEELGMTEGAVSRQIARLEDALGVLLFNRAKGRIRLSEAGRIYWTQVVEHLDGLEQDTQRLVSRPTDGGVLELAVIPTFTNRWIIPRLAEFNQRHPGIMINMSERAEPFLLAGSPFDAAIHYDHPAWTGMIKKDLFAEELVPVCSPSLIGGKKACDLRELRKLPLIHKRGRPEAWKNWWGHLGVAGVELMHGPHYDLFSMAIEAAAAGLGVALVPRLYVTDDVARGRLVIPFDRHVPGDKRYCIVWPEHKHGSWPLQPFVDWLLHEAQLHVRRRTG